MSPTKSFGFTCRECHFVPGRDNLDDYVRTNRISKRTGMRATRNLKWPVRCRSCEKGKKRYQRMRRRLEAIWKVSWAQPGQTYKRPKLITFALPSIWTFEETGEKEVRALNKLMPKARESLMSNNIKGGTFVVECTTRSHEIHGTRVYKHHAHVHMVAVAPFIHKKHLKKFCEQLMTMGLGRINYVAPSGHWKQAQSQVASYISKYLVKDNRRSRTFGIMRRHQQPTQDKPQQ